MAPSWRFSCRVARAGGAFLDALPTRRFRGVAADSAVTAPPALRAEGHAHRVICCAGNDMTWAKGDWRRRGATKFICKGKSSEEQARGLKLVVTVDQARLE